VQFAAYDGNESVVMAYAGNQNGTVLLKLHGLDSGKSYRVSQALNGQKTVMSGTELMEIGLPVALRAECGGLWRIQAMPAAA